MNEIVRERKNPDGSTTQQRGEVVELHIKKGEGDARILEAVVRWLPGNELRRHSLPVEAGEKPSETLDRMTFG